MEKKNLLAQESFVDQVAAFHTLEDMIIYLVGYAKYMFDYVNNEKDQEMETVFSENMFNKRFIKELTAKSSLEEMESCLTEYCRQILEKAVNKKAKKLYQHLLSYPQEERYQMMNLPTPPKNLKPVPATNKGTLSTIFGDIRYTKYGLYIPSINKSVKNYAPIDDFLNIIQSVHYPKSILKKISKLITKMSYQDVADVLNDHNVAITKQSVWNLTREIIAPRIYDYEKEKTLDFLFEKNKEKEKRNISTLFIEWDGVWISLDNTKDIESKTGKKREMKLGKAYIGWAERYGGKDKKVYKTEGTRYVAGFQAPMVLKTMLHGKIDELFDYANVKQIIVNGDGANWIFQDYEDDARVTLQLDMFHIIQNVHRGLKDGKLKNKILKMIDKSQFLEVTEMLRKEIEDNCREQNAKKTKKLLEYLENNFSALKRYQNVTLVKLEDGLEARNLGTMEASVRQVIGRRMTVAAWSMEGARAMATILCLEHEGKLDEVLDIVLDRHYYIKHGDLDLSKFVEDYIKKNDDEMEKRGQEANQKIIAKGKYAKGIANLEINFKQILKKDNTAAKYVMKSLF